MSRPKLLLIGAGGHSRSCIDVIEQNGRYEIAGLIGLPNEGNCRHFGYTVIATDNELQLLINEYQYAVIAIGQIQSPDRRMRLYAQATEVGFKLPSIVAPTAHVSVHATIGAGTVVMHGAIVNAGARIGNNCIINSGALVEHDATVEDHCHISTGAILNGDVTIGSGTFVGSGSIVREGIKLGKRSLVGMGLSVRRNLAEGARFVGGAKA